MASAHDRPLTGAERSAPSGRFLLRMTPSLQAVLRDQAERAGLSLNEYCARKLSAPGVATVSPAVGAMGRAAAATGGRVVSMVAFGSWARGTAREDSDVDLLIVVPPDVAIERELYRGWDAFGEAPDGASERWGGHRVEPHFVHLPGPEDRVTGLWAEVALDGIVLFDPDLALTRHLIALRHRILAGAIVRREVHGHAYWVEAA